MLVIRYWQCLFTFLHRTIISLFLMQLPWNSGVLSRFGVVTVWQGGFLAAEAGIVYVFCGLHRAGLGTHSGCPYGDLVGLAELFR